jgi:hypothetical protein
MSSAIKNDRFNCALGTVVLALAILACGCSPKSPKPSGRQMKSGANAAVATNTTNSLRWESFPLATRMRLSSVPCQLLPKSLIAIPAPVAGELKVYITAPQTNLAANFVWAEFEPKIFAAEDEAIDEARKKLDIREKLQTELEVPRQKLQLSRQMEEAQRHVALLQLLATNKELAELTLSTGIPGENPLKPESLGKAQTELSLIRQTMDYLDATNLAVLGIDLPGQRSEWLRRKLEFDRRRAQATLKMPFKGQLTVSLPLTEGVENYPVTLGQELGVARDLSLIKIRVPLANSSWSALPPEKLIAIVRLPTGRELGGRFLYQKLERIQNREESVYYFQFPSDQSAAALRLIGTDVGCEIWYQLPEPVRVIPKMTVLLENSVDLEVQNWGQCIQGRYPGAELVVEGQTELGVRPPGGASK